MVRSFVENGRVVALVIALLIVSGLGALSTLPRSEDPYITGRSAAVLTPFPGASAERVEALVTEKLENKLRELAELKHITSVSRSGLSFITLELEDQIGPRQVDLIWSRARDLLEEAQADMPAGALPSSLDEDRVHAYTVLVALTWAGSSPPEMAVLGRYGEELESRLRSITGTDLVSLRGPPREEVLVAVDSHKLASLGLSAGEVGTALAGADAKVAAGQLYNDNFRVAVEVAGELDDLERVRRVPLKVDADGTVIRIGDVARVSRQEKLPADELAIVHGNRAVVVAARMVPAVRVDQWTARVERSLAQFSATLPGNITAEIIFNQNDYTRERLSQLMNNVALGFVLILTVLLFTLGWRSALIVAAALPLTAFFTLSCMQYYGLPIHQMSVTGLIVALGIMVDNAIVMVDTVARERQRGATRVQAVQRSIRHLWLPLLGSTTTTILAFLPIALMPGPAGEFVGGIALSVVFSLVGSYVISHTLIAGLAGRWIKPATEGRQRWWQNGVYFGALSRWFGSSLVWALRRPRLTLLLVASVPALGFVAAAQLTEQFFPASDRDMFHVEVFLPESASLDATLELTADVGRVIEAQNGVRGLHWFVGASAPAFYYNLIARRDGAQYYAQAMVTGADFKVVNQMIPRLQRQLDDRFPQAQILVRKLEQGPPFNAPVELRVYGPNLNRLRALGDELRRVLAATPDVLHSRATLGSAVPKLWVSVREEDSNRSGLPLTALSQQLQNALDGVVQGSLLESTQELPVRIRLDGGERAELADLASLDFVPPQLPGGYAGLPLAAIGELQVLPARGTIPRRDGERVNTIEGYLRDGVLPAAVVTAVKDTLQREGFQVPAGYRLEFGGEGEKRNDAVGNLLAYVGVIVTLLVVVVVLSFNSFRMSAIIFSVAIQAAGLGLLSVYLFDYAFGFVVLIALLGLIGLAINAAIVILAELKSDANAVRGDETDVVTGVQNCARHITSTTITTLGGFLPLILGGGGFWPPFAVAIAGGTLLTTLLSFYFVPAAFIVFAQRRSFQQSGAPAPASA
ncbi:efflux RND transporter permease subunit [Exilibacterium tricleocarpae]|uniref:Efflux RND transporter permease subunit n=1 Tax=Exilibacterium tricleocarpae TaxID=2591008 RepID=A0A545U5R8_9GAMM|nr:efflux RND transporter permease subunit [Exilibacterium tricleocarpae]TQV84807.1 efflux RND transporter permease subunit [Exilibacterium tricleocarpae]